MSTHPNTPSTSNWNLFPWALSACILTTVIVNGGLVWIAGRSFPGEAAVKPYEVGTEYNRVLAREAAQRDLGWTVSPKLADRHVVLTLVDRNSAPLAGFDIAGTLTRPVGPPETVTMGFVAGPDGEYHSVQPVPAAGQWDLRLSVKDHDRVIYTAQRRVIAE